MARRTRNDAPGSIHHVFGRGNHKQAIFLADCDCEVFLRRLWSLKQECGFELYAYCLMGNHYHLLIRTGGVPLSIVMHRLLTSYSRILNDRYNTIGHVFQGRYGEMACDTDVYFKELLRYINRNPVKAGLVSTPEQWRWSGHNDLISGQPGLIDRSYPLALFGGGDESTRAYQAFVQAVRTAEALPEEPKSIEQLAKEVSRKHGLTLLSLRSSDRQRQFTRARKDLIREALSRKIRLIDISEYLNITPGAAFHLAHRK